MTKKKEEISSKKIIKKVEKKKIKKETEKKVKQEKKQPVKTAAAKAKIVPKTEIVPKAKKQSSVDGFEKLKAYPIEEAVIWVKKLGKEKFDASIEAHFHLGIESNKGEQQIRSTAVLPHGTGKTVLVAAFVSENKKDACKKAGANPVGGDNLIAKIKKTEKTDFQVAVAEPEMMKKLGPIAKILGTRGLMPSPKNETITPDPAKAVVELKKGKVSFKNDDTGNVHMVIGKKSFADSQLIQNFDTLMAAIKKAKPVSVKGSYVKNISLSSSMGPGIKVEINQ